MEALEGALGSIGESARAKIYGGNAVDFYRLGAFQGVST